MMDAQAYQWPSRDVQNYFLRLAGGDLVRAVRGHRARVASEAARERQRSDDEWESSAESERVAQAQHEMSLDEKARLEAMAHHERFLAAQARLEARLQQAKTAVRDGMMHLARTRRAPEPYGSASEARTAWKGMLVDAGMSHREATGFMRQIQQEAHPVDESKPKKAPKPPKASPFSVLADRFRDGRRRLESEASSPTENARDVVREFVGAGIGKMPVGRLRMIASAYERDSSVKRLDPTKVEELYRSLPSDGLEQFSDKIHTGEHPAATWGDGMDAWLAERGSSKKELLQLCGVPDNATSVTVAEFGRGVYVQSKFPVGLAKRFVVWRAGGAVIVENHRYDSEARSSDDALSVSATSGGWKMLLSQAITAERIRRRTGREVRITTHAGGSVSDRFNGYYTWAQLGYMPNENIGGLGSGAYGPVRGDPPPPMRESWIQLMSTASGCAWWRQHGDSSEHDTHFVFDTTPGSYSMRRLEWYCKRRFSGDEGLLGALTKGLSGDDLAWLDVGTQTLCQRLRSGIEGLHRTGVG